MYHRCQLVVEYAAPQTLPGIIITAKSIYINLYFVSK